MAGGPKAVAVFGLAGPFEILNAEFFGDIAEAGDLFFDTGGGAVEFQEQIGLFGHVHVGVIGVHPLHLQRVQKFDPRQRKASLDRQNDGVDRIINGRERAGGSGNVFGLAIEAHGQFGDDAKRTLRAHEQMRQVVTGRGFACAGACFNDRAVCQNNLKRQNVFAHRAVAHCVGARGAGGRHAAQRCVGTGINGEHQAGGAQVFVQLFARYARLDNGIKVLCVYLKDLVHAAGINADPAVDRHNMTFQRSADAIGNHRAFVFRTNAHDLRHFFGCFGKGHGVGQGGRGIGLVPAVDFADRGACGQAIAKQFADFFYCCGVVRHNLGTSQFSWTALRQQTRFCASPTRPRA